VLLLDPSYHPAFEHILNALTTPVISICEHPEQPGCANDLKTFNAWVVRDGDSLLLSPVRGNFKVKDPWRERVMVTRTPRRNLEAARRIAQEWLESGRAKREHI